MINNDLINDVQKWLTQTLKNGDKNGSSQVENNNNDENEVIDDIYPEDSVSNVAGKHSSRHSAGSRRSRSSTASSRIKAEAERAALVARAAALKGQHALEEQEQQLRRRREQLKLEAEIAATTAKLEIHQASDSKSVSKASSDGMNSYLERKTQQHTTSKSLNPMAKEYEPLSGSSLRHKNSTAMQNVPFSSGARPKETSKQLKAKPTQEAHVHTGYQQIAQHVLSVPHVQPSLDFTQPMQLQPEEEACGGIYNIMQRQNEITAALVQQQLSMSLPARDIPVFDGNPLEYRAFIRAFEHGVEDRANKADSLYFLEQFTRGQPRELVRSCQHMVPERGYALAKELLHEHFGNEFKIAAAYTEKALAWPPVKSEDVKALQAYSLFLQGCCNMMKELEYMTELDTPTTIRSVMSKLPFKLRESWRTAAHDVVEKYKRRARFTDLVAFTECEVKILSDSVFGDIQDSSFVKTGLRNTTKPLHRKDVKGSSFATTIKLAENVDETGANGNAPRKQGMTERRNPTVCMCCSHEHSLEECPQLNRKKHREKINFLKEKGVCFACLCIGHMSKDCEKRLTCKGCGKGHPTVLHVKKERASTDLKQSKGPAYSGASVSQGTCGHTGAGKDDCVLSILPVKVKSTKGGKVIHTYAFLDPGSSATFCSESLMQELNIEGRRANFLLRSMGQEKVVPTYTLTGLEASGLNDECYYQLPDVLTQRKMPVTSDNIITQEDLARWPYLSTIQIPCIKASVDLLIGSNAPKLLEPWDIVNSCGGGPYAIKTVLGWVINGPVQGSNTANLDTRQGVRNLS